MPTVLIVDDEPSVRSTLRRMLRDARSCSVLEAGDGVEAAEMIASRRPDLVITDMDMPRGDGLMVLAAGQQARIDVVVLSGHTADDNVSKAMQLGARDYLSKPFKPEHIKDLLAKVFGALPTRAPGEVAPSTGALLGSDESFMQVLDVVKRVADSNTTILLTGESGTGKEMVARAIHNASKRAAAPFVPVNCGAIPENLLESELFGHARGAFTGATQARKGRFQVAEGGTLFLDEIGDMPMALQVKLLRVLQERTVDVLGESASVKVDVRIVCATHRNLEEMVSAGTFREDLYYRLNVVPLRLPPLRYRKGDIPSLVRHFIGEAKASGRQVTGITDEALTALGAYHWPGNVRELANIVERMAVLRGNGMLTLDDVPEQIRKPRAPATGEAPSVLKLPPEGVDLAELLQKVESSLIDEALARTGGNRSQAASLLKINRTTLVEKLKRRGIVAGED